MLHVQAISLLTAKQKSLLVSAPEIKQAQRSLLDTEVTPNLQIFNFFFPLSHPAVSPAVPLQRVKGTACLQMKKLQV